MEAPIINSPHGPTLGAESVNLTGHSTSPHQAHSLAESSKPARKPTAKRSTGKVARELNHQLRTNPPVLIDERELSYITGLSPRTLRNYVRDGIIPRIKISRRILFRWPQVEAALTKLETKGGTK